METITNIQALSKSKLIQITKEHINKNQELKKKLDNCLDADTHRFSREARSLESMLTNIIEGAIKPVKTMYLDQNNDRQWHFLTVQNAFWGCRNAVIESDVFSKAWLSSGFRRAIIAINLIVESLPGNVDMDKKDDFDYQNAAGYLLEDDSEVVEGFVMFRSMIDQLSKEDLNRWGISSAEHDILKLSLQIIITTQKIWSASHVV
jgi:hypothetical protein